MTRRAARSLEVAQSLVFGVFALAYAATTSITVTTHKTVRCVQNRWTTGGSLGRGYMQTNPSGSTLLDYWSDDPLAGTFMSLDRSKWPGVVFTGLDNRRPQFLA